MANRVVNHGDPAWRHAVFCKGCSRFHGPLFVCDSYDGDDIAAVNNGRVAYANAKGVEGTLMRLVFPPAPPVSNFRDN